MKHLYYFILVSLINVPLSMALAPDPKLIETDTIGFVKNFVSTDHSVMISSMPSDFNFADLTAEKIKAIDGAHALKRDYGKMFGFNDWKVHGQKFANEASDRILLIEGSYKTDKDKLVSFLEVYWADAKSSRQFLITSEKQTLNMNAFQEYLVK